MYVYNTVTHYYNLHFIPGSTPICFYKQIHDGPINKVIRHPGNNKIFLSSGGHVFGLWKVEQVW